MTVEDLQPIDPVEKAERVAVLFNGFYVIRSASGEERVLRVRTNHWSAKFLPGKRVVALLTGTRREQWDHWTSFGFVSDRGIAMYPSKRHDPEETSRRTVYEHLAKMLWSLATEGRWSRWRELGYEIEFEKGTCILCNKPLTNEVSRRTGIGPFCAGRRKGKKNVAEEFST